jgi:hypothetical protein
MSAASKPIALPSSISSITSMRPGASAFARSVERQPAGQALDRTSYSCSGLRPLSGGVRDKCESDQKGRELGCYGAGERGNPGLARDFSLLLRWSLRRWKFGREIPSETTVHWDAAAGLFAIASVPHFECRSVPTDKNQLAGLSPQILILFRIDSRRGNPSSCRFLQRRYTCRRPAHLCASP